MSTEAVSHRPQTEEELAIVLTGLGSDARQQAKDAAHERHNQYLHEKGGLRGFTRKIWDNLSGEARRHRFEMQARHEIEESGNVFQHLDVTDEEWADVKKDTILRFTHEYDDYLDQEAGEKRTELSGEDSPEAQAVKDAVNSLIKDYAEGRLNDDSFEEEKNRVLSELAKKGVTKNLIGEGSTFADNLHQIAQAVSHRVNYEKSALSVDEVLANTKFIVGEARIGARSEADMHMVERLAKKMDRWAINESTAVTAASVVYAVGRWSAQTATGAALRFGAVGVGAGLWAGVRARAEAKTERRLLSRERAMGIERDDADKHEAELNETLVESKNASEIISDLNALFNDEGKIQIDSVDSLRHATALLADVKARQKLSAQRKTDLISFSSVQQSANERLQLMRLSAQLTTQLRGKFEELPEEDQKLLVESGNFDDFRDNSVDAATGSLIETIDESDKLARKLYNKRFAKGFIKGTVLGMTFGLAAQEAAAAAVNGQHGLVDSILDRDNEATSTTLLNASWEPTAERQNVWNLSGESSTYNVFQGPNGEQVDARIPDGFTLEKGLDGWVVTNPSGESVSGLAIESNGQLSQESISKLRGIGLEMVGTNPHYEPITNVSHEQVTVGVDEYVASHQGETMQVSRDYWYDNDSASYDKNELQLHWGGNGGVDESGNVVFDVSGMTEQGSYNGDVTASPESLHNEDKLSLLVSASKGTQSQVFEIPIGPNGQAVIDRNSPIAQLFEVRTGENGNEVIFHGGYVEVAHELGVQDGVMEIAPLATFVGENDAATLTDVREVVQTVPRFEYEFNAVNPVIEIQKDVEVDIPPVIPIYARNGLKPRTAMESSGTDPSESPTGYADSPENYESRAQRRREAMSPRLQEDQEAKLDSDEELSWYFKKKGEKKGKEYVDNLDERLRSAEGMNSPEQIKAIINIPVAAAVEGDNIYKTLSLYADQDPDALKSTQFMLSLNWQEGADPDAVQRTIDAVERAKRDYPQLNINYFTEQWSQDFVKSKKGAIYGTVISSLYDTSLRMVHQRLQNNPGSGENPMIVTNDADAQKISANYLRQIIRTSEDNPDSDVLLGKIHWGTETFDSYPGYAFTSSFFMLLEDRIRDEQDTIIPASWGPNSAFRAASVAAVGGVDDEIGAGADSELGRSILVARGGKAGNTKFAGDAYGRNETLTGAGKWFSIMKGAWVDSAPERLLNQYKKGEPLTNAWNTFDRGGYQPRPRMNFSAEKEDVSRNFDQIKERIENQLNGILSSGWSIVDDPRVIEIALQNIMPPSVYVGANENDPLWVIEGERHNRRITFTEAGERSLRLALETISQNVEEGLGYIDDIYSPGQSAGDTTGSESEASSTGDYGNEDDTESSADSSEAQSGSSDSQSDDSSNEQSTQDQGGAPNSSSEQSADDNQKASETKNGSGNSNSNGSGNGSGNGEKKEREQKKRRFNGFEYRIGDYFGKEEYPFYGTLFGRFADINVSRTAGNIDSRAFEIATQALAHVQGDVEDPSNTKWVRQAQAAVQQTYNLMPDDDPDKQLMNDAYALLNITRTELIAKNKRANSGTV